MTRIVTVLQTRALNALQPGSSEFKALHVVALQKQLAKWAPSAMFECLTDIDIPGVKCTPLKRKWPGWWSKLELFDPELPGDFLFVDLDTVITGPLDDILAVNKLTLLRDFYRDGKKLKEGLGGGLMYLPHKARHPVWDDFTANPTLSMRLFSRGDQFLFEQHYLSTAARWQDVVPDQVISYKVHCVHGIPEEARVVCFHGKPRPWEVGQFLHLYR
jgi:hypothetical protein